ncbi:MAG: DUF481 domain-containing protein [Candidatus Hatepunaea meridiana]|nr:DUF481 domain-containing protein [Candidatus Hatepunaea meridiana]
MSFIRWFDERQLFFPGSTIKTGILIVVHQTYSLTGYFQPDINNPSDFRILVNSELEIKLSETFSFTAEVKYRHDSEPPQGLKDYDINISNGISFTF